MAIEETRTITGTNGVPISSHRAHRFGHLYRPESVRSSTSSLDTLAEAATTCGQAVQYEGISESKHDGGAHIRLVNTEGVLGADTKVQDRGRSLVRRIEDGLKQRKRGNRWAEEGECNTAASLTGLPTAILGGMTAEQLEAYTIHLRIEEISQKLRIGDIVPPTRIRSPSPPPVYDNRGVRSNTREQRYRRKLEAERHKLIEQASMTIPNYRAPADYRRPTKTHEKIYVPVNDYPEINFNMLIQSCVSVLTVGLLIGPRGNTLKDMEAQSGAKISIRGKGSVKEGKGGSDRAFQSNLEEDLHCLIIADSEAKLNKAKALINIIIETAASVPEKSNDLKRGQLRMLATLNGTLRDDENQICQNCGATGHRKYECPEEKNFTANVICHSCGNHGHLARDCSDRSKGRDWRARPLDAVDQEYEHLMNELAGIGAANLDKRQPCGEIKDGNTNHQNSNPWSRDLARAPWKRTKPDESAATVPDKFNQPWHQPPPTEPVGYTSIPVPYGASSYSIAPIQQSQILSAMSNVTGAPGTSPSHGGTMPPPPPPPAWAPPAWINPTPWNIPPPPLGEVPPSPPSTPKADISATPLMEFDRAEAPKKRARYSEGM